MAQHARPKVMGQSADLRAQLTTGAAMSTVLAPTVRRIEFMIESTVVRTNPSSCSAISYCQLPIADCRFILSSEKPNWQSAIENRQCFRPTPVRLCATRNNNQLPESL